MYFKPTVLKNKFKSLADYLVLGRLTGPLKNKIKIWTYQTRFSIFGGRLETICQNYNWCKLIKFALQL